MAALQSIISVDEKPGIQALERATGCVRTDRGKIVQGFKSIQKRHGVLNLIAALEVAASKIHTRKTRLKRRLEFSDVYYMHLYRGGQEQLILKGGKEEE